MKEYILSEYDTPFSALENVIGELVRCKDCKHNNSKSTSFVACVLVGEMYGRKADNYCSLAEVKEE